MVGGGLAAIIVAGGAATRLGGFPKAALTGADGRSLLRCAVDACAPARPVVVVGRDVASALAPATDIVTACEEPVGSGPARAVAAGLARLALLSPRPRRVLLLAGDLPAAAPAVGALLAALAESSRRPQPVQGAVAVAAGRRQWLLGVYRFDALAEAAALPPWRLGQRGESLRGVLGGLDLVAVEVDPAAAADLDTWADAARAGFTAPDSLVEGLEGGLPPHRGDSERNADE